MAFVSDRYTSHLEIYIALKSEPSDRYGRLPSPNPEIAADPDRNGPQNCALPLAALASSSAPYSSPSTPSSAHNADAQGPHPREGLCADVVLRLIRQTALNPALLLPLVLLARFTRKGQDLAILHPTAASRLKKLFWVAVARAVSAWMSDRARNNWVDDRYNWPKEIVVITGGAGGIGGRMVKLFEERGTTVVVLDIQPMSFAVSSNVHHYHCDIRSPEAVAAVAAKIKAQVGHPTVLINNAGVARGKTVLDSEPGDVRFTFEVNTLAQYWTVKAFLPDMVAKNHGMVVTIASYASWLSIPNMVDYGASKAAALALHEGLTAELTTRYKAPKVRTVIVHPGHTKTALFRGYDQKTQFVMPQLEPETVADAVVGQILTGRSGQVILPGPGVLLSTLRMLPDWLAVPLRARGQSYTTDFRGRQVVDDVDAPYSHEDEATERVPNDTSETSVRPFLFFFLGPLDSVAAVAVAAACVFCHLVLPRLASYTRVSSRLASPRLARLVLPRCDSAPPRPIAHPIEIDYRFPKTLLDPPARTGPWL
ncbi:hypothetical protein G7046_g7928 [Stylonectria norvegica]|nr:hypothetical protein G7046_g7928 [Stylonectria norvegica]